MGVEPSERKGVGVGGLGVTRVQKQARAKTQRQGEAKGANIKQLLLIALSIHIMPVISPISLSALTASGKKAPLAPLINYSECLTGKDKQEARGLRNICFTRGNAMPISTHL